MAPICISDGQTQSERAKKIKIPPLSKNSRKRAEISESQASFSLSPLYFLFERFARVESGVRRRGVRCRNRRQFAQGFSSHYGNFSVITHCTLKGRNLCSTPSLSIAPIPLRHSIHPFPLPYINYEFHASSPNFLVNGAKAITCLNSAGWFN